MSRKTLFSIVSLGAVVCLLLIAGCGRRARAKQQAREFAGTYFFKGGLAYLNIEADEAGGLSITEFSEPLFSQYVGSMAETFPVSYAMTLKGNRLRIETESRDPFGGLFSMGTGKPPEARRPHHLILQLSSSGSGDFDLIEKKVNFFDDNKVDRFRPAKPSYLRRFDDLRVEAYFDAQRADRNPEAALSIAKALSGDYPDDLHIKCIYLEALLKAHKFEEFGARFDEWEAELLASTDRRQRDHSRLARYLIESAAMAESGSNAYEFYHEHMGWTTAEDAPPGRVAGLEEWMADFSSIIKYDHLRTPYEELNTRRWPHTSNNFLRGQVLMKIMGIEANFLLLQGKRDQALDILHASAHHGWMTRTTGFGGVSMIGVAFQSIALSGLENYVLNGCETEVEFERVASVLSEIRPQFGPIEFFDPFDQEPAEDPESEEALEEAMLDWQIREATNRTRLELLRLALAARRHLATRGRFPETEAELIEFLNDAIPADPNGDGLIKFKIEGDEFVIYGVGPDGIDDGGRDDKVPYYGNPTEGDIVLRVPRERKYPFPSSPLVAASRADVLAVFPNGLPTDTFAFTRNQPLQITDTVPVYIYSYGPDVDQNQTTSTPGPLGPGVHPEPQYDPREGATSDGDLWYRVPTSEEDL